MRLKFKNQDFQTNAVNAAVDLFVGQENTYSTLRFTGISERLLCWKCFENRSKYIGREYAYSTET